MKALATNLIAAALVATTVGPAWAEDFREVREAATDGRIELSAIIGNFTVVGHDAEEFILEGRLGDEVAEVVIDGDRSNWRIELEPVKGKFDGRSNFQSSELTLYVPRGSDLEINTHSGAIVVRELSGPALEVESVSGKVELEKIDSGEVEVQTVSGDVSARAVTSEVSEYQSISGNLDIRGARGRLDIETVSGHIELEASDVSEFESETVAGNVMADLTPSPGASLNLSSHSGTLQLHLRLDDTPRIRAETYSGHIDSDFGESEESGMGAGESLRVDGGAGAVKLEAKTFSGSVTIRRAD